MWIYKWIDGWKGGYTITKHCGLELNQDKSKCRPVGPMCGENIHKTMMIPCKTKIFQRDLFEKIRFKNFKFNFQPIGVAA